MQCDAIISLDKQKQPPYTSAVEKQSLTNSIHDAIMGGLFDYTEEVSYGR
jgi:hypothetical protein